MVIRRKAELVTGAILASFGSFVIYEACGLPYSSEFGPGPGFFPLWVGIGIALCSVVMLCASFLHGDIGSEGTEISARALGAWTAFVFTLVLLPLVGFGLSLGLLTAFLIVVLDRRSPWAALAVALGLAFGFHLVFVIALGVSLPVGPFGF
jgi:putative tricarboxylic transport membrane protein